MSKKKLLFFSVVTSLLLSACNAAKVPMSVKEHDMSSMEPVTGDETKSDWTLPKDPKANEDVPMSIVVKDKHDKLIKQFETVSEKKMHLVIVSKDLSYFSHIHPTLKDNGEFTITTKFPAGGDYKMTAEMTPVGASEYSLEDHWVHVVGDEPKPKPIVPDKNLTKVIDGKKVTLSFENELKAKKNTNITFTLYDEQTKKPIKDLQPYLGTIGHAVAIDKDLKHFLHVHPIYTKTTGPEVTFMTYFPNKGIYRIWGQFNIDGNILTVPFTLEVF
ncbi:hypothetical protein [Heyndrickxia sporothermodurans]|uniref:Uncharacterized protein n=1 Tax=Heyndrickxia sporothermodurans TaxID=46224 RepID=A0A150LB77_9BACI|nr:hypothetical protein [Heyndrickxia sporothermodurans]KYD09534.1 hypothetical protein B4102_1932 [Heyndrickxia sporothermodurans]